MVNGSRPTNLNSSVHGRPDLDPHCAVRDVRAGGECWAHRRHARRVWEIGQTFEQVFGRGTLNHRVRMVYASWSASEQEYFNNTLAWLQQEHSPVRDYVFAMATAQYEGPTTSDNRHGVALNYSTATIPQVVQAFREGIGEADGVMLIFVRGSDRCCVIRACSEFLDPHPLSPHHTRRQRAQRHRIRGSGEGPGGAHG